MQIGIDLITGLEIVYISESARIMECVVVAIRLREKPWPAKPSDGDDDGFVVAVRLYHMNLFWSQKIFGINSSMGIEVAEAVDTVISPSSIKVHRLMCTDLMKIVDRISEIIPEIETARPRCSLGIESLCLLSRAIEKANLLFQYCSESSKFYLAITRDTIVSRCERSRTLLEQSLSQLQDMVPITLAIEISRIIGDLRSITFTLDPSEEEAGKVLQALFQQSTKSVEKSEMEALQVAALRLHIRTTRALLMEKRSVKNLADKVSDNDSAKNKILYLYYLMKKYGKHIIQPGIDTTTEDPTSNCCMGNELATASMCMELDSVESWKTSSSSDFSILSPGSSDGSFLSDYSRVQRTDTNEQNSKFLFDLNMLSWESQRKVVEDLKYYIDSNDQAFDFVTSENFVEPLIRFLKDARDLSDVECQKYGSRLLLAFVNRNRSGTSCLPEDILSLFSSILDSEVNEEALHIMVTLSDHKHWRSKLEASHVLNPISTILDSQASEYQESAIKILFNWSTNNESHSHILSSDLVPKLIPFLYDGALSKLILLILKNLCATEEGRLSIAETSGCLASIAELLNIGSLEDQEHAIAILLFLCTHCAEHCKLVMEEGIIPSLCSIFINGNERGRMGAKELLGVLREMKYCDVHERSGPGADGYRDSKGCFEMKKSGSMAHGFGRKISVFIKFAPFSPKKKK